MWFSSINFHHIIRRAIKLQIKFNWFLLYVVARQNTSKNRKQLKQPNDMIRSIRWKRSSRVPSGRYRCLFLSHYRSHYAWTREWTEQRKEKKLTARSMAFEVDTDVLVAVCACKLSLCRYTSFVCPCLSLFAKPSVMLTRKKGNEWREKDRQRTRKRIGRKFYV